MHSTSRLDRLGSQLSRAPSLSPGALSLYNCLGACNCAAALGGGRGRGSVLGPLLAPAEATGNIHGVLHTLRDDQNRNATFSAGNPPGAVIESGGVFEVQCLCASGGWVTRDGVPSPVRTDRRTSPFPSRLLIVN